MFPYNTYYIESNYNRNLLVDRSSHKKKNSSENVLMREKMYLLSGQDVISDLEAKVVPVI